MEDRIGEMTWRLLNLAADLLRLDPFVAGGGELENVTMSQQNVLAVVYTHPEGGLMVKDIADEINVTRGAVSQTVEALVKLGMLERVQSEVDRRAVFVRATPKGVALREKLIQKVSPVLREVASEVNPTDLNSCILVLETLVHRLREMNTQRKLAKKTVPVMEESK